MTTTSPTRQQTLVRGTWQPLATVGPTWQVSGNPWSSNAVVASLPEKKQQYINHFPSKQHREASIRAGRAPPYVPIIASVSLHKCNVGRGGRSIFEDYAR